MNIQTKPYFHYQFDETPQTPSNSPLDTPRIDDIDLDEEIDARDRKRAKTQGNEK